MKKLLLASTALVITAGVAAADVTLSGDARMGVIYDGDDVGFTSRARVTFTLSGETDGGLAFGGSFRADNAAASTSLTGAQIETAVVDAVDGANDAFDAAFDAVIADGGTPAEANAAGEAAAVASLRAASFASPTGGAVNGAAGSVFISGEFGRLTMGDVAGAAEYIVGDLAGVGLTGLGDLNENTYLSNGGANRPAARYQYELDGLKFAISADQPTAGANVYSVGVGYEFEGFGGGIGYETVNGGGDHAIAYLSASFSGVNAKATYGRATGSLDQYGLSVSGTFDATTVTAFARRDFADLTHYGVGASYDLGGGASIVGGVVRQDLAVGNNTIADFGLSFSF